MGARDVEEQLEGALADAIVMETALAAISRTATDRLRSEHASVTDAGVWADVKRTADGALLGRTPLLHEHERLTEIARLALLTSTDTRVEILALAAEITPAEAIGRLRASSVPQPAPTDPEEDSRA
jgi:hypothetical protein